MNDKQIFNLVSLLGPVRESDFSRLLSLDHGRLRSKLNKMMLEGQIVRYNYGRKVFYKTDLVFIRRSSFTLPEIKKKIRTFIEENPGKNIMYYSDCLTMLGIGQGYDSNQKLIRRMGEKGILVLRINGSNTLCYPNYHYHEVTTSKNEDYGNYTFDWSSNIHSHYGPFVWTTSPQNNQIVTSDNSFTIRSDVTIESFVRQMAKLQRKYPNVKKFKLVPLVD